ncbi:DeoR/GlpR transcriptional regulator [Enterococcus sp. BWB1-3]|uniref:DeoR/GlpR family DNA-binding transcription regulator n=1 Tax=unclassified Enterococcus TaxID=2608891 RepID=UPI001921DEF1|nr:MULTISPECIES: DeoR/GlpR family DNA-binding transcription regulator [unclassified Enterococcus]MBL1228209.1 DeoR/GlpR transcriptional regulator [Enterococcus sp. BWB1-3]MCB5951946.1 DeoR/GlpR family DNA-binding transcription regulator [Enterococcus sp. BWT-B8]
MKSSYKTIQNRRDQIFEIVKEKEIVTVREISDMLAVSEITIRRDLNAMEKMGLILREHGKARILQKENGQVFNKELESLKCCIAQKAAEFVKDGDTLFINTSSTALAAIKKLEEKRVTIVTNNVKVANIDHNPNSTVILSGGEIRFPKEALVGDIAIESFSKMSSDISIIGCSGLSLENGITTPVLHEAKINSLIIERTRGPVIVVADYRKIGVSSNFTSGNIKDIDYLITDSFASPESLNTIEKMGVRVIQIEI